MPFAPRARALSLLAAIALIAPLLAASPAAAQISAVGGSVGVISMGVLGNDTAYDPVNHVYLLIGGYGAIKGAFVNESGAAIGGGVTIAPGTTYFGHYPRVLYSPDINGTGGFLVTWHQNDGASGANVVHARTVSYGGALGTDFTLGPTSGGSYWLAGPAIAYSRTSHVFMVTWQTTAYQIQAVTVGLNGQAIGSPFVVSTLAPGRDPNIAWNSAADEFGFIYSGFGGGYAAYVAFARVSVGGVVLRNNVFFQSAGTFITEIIYNPVSGNFVGAYAGGGVRTSEFNAAGDVLQTNILGVGTNDSIGLALNPLSGTILAVGQGTTGSYEISAAEVDGHGVRTSAVQNITSTGSQSGNFYPRTTTNTTRKDWDISFSYQFGAVDSQVVTTTSSPGSTTPTVVTSAASGISTTGATLNGTVNPNGLSTTATFDWGSNPSYANHPTASPAPGSGSSPVSVSATISGLACNTQYHFRVAATNSNGPATGNDTTFTTSACPVAPTAVTVAASAVTTTTATLNGTVNPNGLSTTATFDWGSNPSYPNHPTASPAPGSGSSPVSVSAAISGLTCNTQYHFRVAASNGAGPDTGNDTTFTTSACLVAPTSITIAATAITTTTAILNGTVNPNGLSTTALFDFGSAAPAYGTQVSGTPAPGFGSLPIAVSAAISGLTCNTTYHFRVSASSAGGPGNGGDLTLTTGACLPPGILFNGDFSDGANHWLEFATPNMSYMVWNVSAEGVFQFYRQQPQQGTTNEAVVLQSTGIGFPAGGAVTAQFDLGNSSNVRKRIKVLIHDLDFTDLAACSFWLPANAPLRTYSMKAHSTKAGTNATLSFYAATIGADGGYYQIDNVTVAADANGSGSRTDCIDPTAPAQGGNGNTPNPPNLLVNGDFSNGLGPWALFGDITEQITNGVFEFYRATNSLPAGVVLQATGQTMTAGQVLTTTLRLGNSSGARKRVTVIVNDLDFSDLIACTFWLDPNAALATYVVHGFTTEAWTNATVSIYPSTVGTEQWIQLDDVTLQRTSDTTFGTECVEPGALSARAAGSEGSSSLASATTGSPSPVADYRPSMIARVWDAAPVSEAVDPNPSLVDTRRRRLDGRRPT